MHVSSCIFDNRPLFLTLKYSEYRPGKYKPKDKGPE